MKLFLDDLRPCPEGYVLARTVEEAIAIMNGPQQIKIISLDHDLGGIDGTYTKTGYDFCLWLIEKWYYDPFSFAPNDIYMHTSNPVGRSNMFQLLSHYAPNYVKIHRGPDPYWMVRDE